MYMYTRCTCILDAYPVKVAVDNQTVTITIGYVAVKFAVKR